MLFMGLPFARVNGLNHVLKAIHCAPIFTLLFPARTLRAPARIKQAPCAVRIAIESYREMIAYLGDRDPTTHRMLEVILASEEEHADDLSSLLEGMKN